MNRNLSFGSLLLTILVISSSCEEYDDGLADDFDDQFLEDRASSTVGTYQAEDRTFQSGCKEMTNMAGYTGRGFTDFGGNGSLVEWNNVNAPSAGQYTLVFRYANGSAGNRQCAITVNDTINAGNVTFGKTGAWTTWGTNSIKVALRQGKNKIRVAANTGSGGPNLDKMDLISNGDTVVVAGRCALVNENSTATLSCPSGQVIKNMDFASYGLPTGSCSAGFSTGTCHASTGKSKVQSLCLNKQSCTVGVNNATFGDPCPGKAKKLAVLYTCSGGTTGLAAKDFVGHYERTPAANNWHRVDITLENNALWWKNAAGVKWSLVYAGGVLKTGSDCNYGVQVIEVEKQSGSDPIKSLKFNGERYYKSGDNNSDQCPNDPNKTEPGKCGCGVPEGTCNTNGTITHVATTVIYDPDGQNVTIARPSGVKAGDLLVLVLHRTDDDLPLYVNGWNRAAECHKSDNGQECRTEDMCAEWHNDDFCRYFGTDRWRTSSGNLVRYEGHDLAQSVFFKEAGSNEPSSYRFNLNRDSSGHPGWAILTALRGADTRDPIRDWSHMGCDRNTDSLFPSVYGQAGDMVLLSQSFDDPVAQSKFGAPSGTRTFGYVDGERRFVSQADQNTPLKNDETGFLFGGILTRSGETGTLKTNGDGASSCKDILVSLTIKPQ